MTFNVHFEVEGIKLSKRVDAKTPAEAGIIIRKQFQGAIVKKTKVWKSTTDES